VLYNFRIQISVWFYSIFGDFRVQTRAHRHSLGPERDVARSARPRCASHGIRAAAPAEDTHLPRPHLPQVPAPCDALKSACHAPPRHSRRATRLPAVHAVPCTDATAGPSMAPSPVRTPTETATVPRPVLASSIRHKQASAPI
jgi:hypothetical protein